MIDPLCGCRRTLIASRVLCATGFAVLTGCTVNPNTSRNQLIALPAAQIAHANMGFAFAAAAGLSSSVPCGGANASGPPAGARASPCAGAEQIARFSQQVERIGAELVIEARILDPELFTRIGAFQIGVQTDIGAGTASNAGGRIVVASDLAALDPTDDVVAFLIAREMGHVIARHGEENAGARMAASALTAIIPIGGAIAKLAVSILGSHALTTTWAASQRREADELALVLLERCHRSPAVIALNLRAGLRRDRLPASEWGEHFAQSIERVGALALARAKGTQLAAVGVRGASGR